MIKLIKDIFDQAFKQGTSGRYNFKGYTKHFYWYFQRLFKGYDDSQTFSLYMDITEWILPRLIRFQELKNGYPMDYSEEEWDEIVDKMILAFELIIEEDMDFDPYDKTRYELRNKKIDEGLVLFAKCYKHLWW